MVTPDYTKVDAAIKAVSAQVNGYVSGVSEFVDTTLWECNNHFDTLRALECIKTARYTTQNIKAGVTIAILVDLKIQQIWFHRSPQIMGIILVISGFVNFITSVINFVRSVAQIVRIVSTINEILTALWPQYREFITRIWRKVSQLSAAIGWGVDGFLHIVNAVQSGWNIWGAIQGKSPATMEIEIGQKAVDMGTSLSFWLEGLTNDPGAVVKNLVFNQKMVETHEQTKWWGNLMSGINAGLFRGEQALRHVQTTYTELAALRNNMPSIIAQHIPSGIWTALDDADEFIHDKIMPALTQVKALVETLDRVTLASNNRLAELARKLASPGDLLLGVDDLLPSYKKLQEGMIDDVTSREFDFWADTERVELQGDIREFERVQKLMEAPTPQPAFMAIEIPRGVTLRGITAEPHETWFIGGYNDSH